MPDISLIAMIGAAPTSGIVCAAYKASRFGAVPVPYDTPVPGGAPDAVATSGEAFGSRGAVVLAVPTFEGYWISMPSGGHIGWVESPTPLIPESDVTALLTDLGLKAPLASPTFTGIVTAPAGRIHGALDFTNSSSPLEISDGAFNGPFFGAALGASPEGSYLLLNPPAPPAVADGSGGNARNTVLRLQGTPVNTSNSVMFCDAHLVRLDLNNYNDSAIASYGGYNGTETDVALQGVLNVQHVSGYYAVALPGSAGPPPSGTITDYYGFRSDVSQGSAAAGGLLVNNAYGAYLKRPFNVIGTNITVTNHFSLFAEPGIVLQGKGTGPLKDQIKFQDTDFLASPMFLENVAGNLSFMVAAGDAVALSIGQNAVVSAGSALVPSLFYGPSTHIFSGNTVPNIATSVAGDVYFRSDTPSTLGQRQYIATGVNTWVETTAALAPLASPAFTGTPTFPAGSIAAAALAAIAESGVTGLVSDLGLKAPLASPTFTGTVSVTGPIVVGGAGASSGFIAASVGSSNLLLQSAGGGWLIHSNNDGGSGSLFYDGSTNLVAAISALGLSLSDAKNIVLATTTGTKIGTDVAQKFAFHNSTPVVQRAGAAQVAAATTAATNTTPYGFTTAAQADAVITLLNEVRAALVEKGLIKGAA